MTTSPLTPLSFHILVCLSGGPAHGYGILKEIEERTGGREVPSTGALYLALQRLERDGDIEEAPAPSDDADGRRRYWALTSQGLRAAAGEAERMAALLDDDAVRALRRQGKAGV